jgi:hypothetical protein
MSCPSFRDRLALFLYGDLDACEEAEVRDHLAGCAPCRQELAALQQVRRALDGVPVPPIAVDLPRLYQQAAARQQRQARRWRRAALAVCGLAAALVLLMLARVEIRCDHRQFVVRWGAPAEAEVAPTLQAPATPVTAPQPPPLPSWLQERLQVLDELVHALAADVQDRDAEQRRRIARLQVRLEELQAQAGRRLYETERQVRALYVAQFQPPPKGEQR